MVGQVGRGEADISPAGFAITKERSAPVDFLEVVFHHSVSSKMKKKCRIIIISLPWNEEIFLKHVPN